jgi:glycosyltransferase involved in cell wall biosynthesis
MSPRCESSLVKLPSDKRVLVERSRVEHSLVKHSFVERRLTFVIPGDLNTVTGGYAYDRHIIEGLKALGWGIELLSLGEGFPFPSLATREEAHRQLQGLPEGQALVIDGLAGGVLADVLPLLAEHHPILLLVHHPLYLESGLSPEQQRDLKQSESASLQCATHCIVTSHTTALLLQDLGVEPPKISVVVPGVQKPQTDGLKSADTQPKRPPDLSSTPVVELLCVGSLIARKGHELLVLALSELRTLPWRLTLVGDTERDTATRERVFGLIESSQLGERITWRGTLSPEQLALQYAGADVFVLPSLFEGYGMAFAEAMTHGLPIIGTTGGAIVQTVPESAGLLVSPNDVSALVQALKMMITHEETRQHYAQGARRHAQGLPTWATSSAQFSGVLERVLKPA